MGKPQFQKAFIARMTQIIAARFLRPGSLQEFSEKEEFACLCINFSYADVVNYTLEI